MQHLSSVLTSATLPGLALQDHPVIALLAFEEPKANFHHDYVNLLYPSLVQKCFYDMLGFVASSLCNSHSDWEEIELEWSFDLLPPDD